jgi:GntR family transcriptional regulator
MVVNMPKHIPVRDSRASTLPLYRQVRDTLFERIKSGTLRPGEELGSEFQLAAELGVSQGTVRKALEALRAENLLVRQQGRGTFVAEQTPASVLFRYFNIFDETGKQVLPDSRDARVATGIASIEQQRRLRMEPGTQVIQITRIRTWQRWAHKVTPFITETIILPAALFPALESLSPVPNTLYDLFQSRYSITVTHIDEQITPVPAPSRVADKLGLVHGTPLLLIDRTTYSLGGMIVEWRVSYCLMAGCHYRLQVR